MTTHTETPERASWRRVIVDQRKIEILALGLMVFSLWFYQVHNDWRLPIALASGILLGLLNHLATEYWLLRIIVGGDQPTRGQLTRSTVIRLAVLVLVAVGLTVALWHHGDGIGVLLGLAIFRLIALVMTTIPLLKELKNQ